MLPLVCIDVDGTLIGSSGVPSFHVLETINRALSRGQQLCLSTARGAMGPTYRYAEMLNPNGWHIFHSGGVLLHTGSGEVVDHTLPQRIVDLALEVSQENNWAIEFYSARDYRAGHLSGSAAILDHAGEYELAVAHSEMLGVEHISGTPSDLSGGIVRVQFVVRESSANEVQEAMSGFGKLTAATSPALPGVAFISITDEGVDKGSAISYLASLLGFDLSSVMMVGDGLNDLDALNVVGHPVAMGNGHAEVLSVGKYIVSSVEDDGLCDAIELSWDL
ncbi:MAG: HAD hydrolase family protein [Actinomycetota bacterium]